MANTTSPSEEWLDHEDKVAKEGRATRLEWLLTITPTSQYWMFRGGMITKSLFEETRYCFVYGQFLAVIMLGLSYIEHTLAAMFYGTGRDDLERANISTLLREALNHGWITTAEHENLNKAREIRNSVTHFRKPMHEETLESRSVDGEEMIYEIIEEDARHIIETVYRMLGKNAV